MQKYGRYAELCEKLDLSPSRAAELAGLTASAATGWKKTAEPSSQNRLKLVKFFRSRGLEVPSDYFDPDGDAAEVVAEPVQPDIIPSSSMRPILGFIPAGPTQYEAQDIIGYAPTTEKNPEDTFWLIVHGDSMIDAGIKPNDRVLIRCQDYAEDGQIVACFIEGQATLKRLRRDGARVYLCPENSFYSNFELTTTDFEEGRAKIIGVALEVSHRL